MSEVLRLLLLLALAGTTITFIGSAAIWAFDEERRIRRALTRVLKAPPEAVLIAHGRGRGTGFSFDTALAAVAWDSGAWCLVYRLDELTGAELLVDGQVIARAARGEPRRALDQIATAAEQVTLRLVFDDPRHPDFDLDLYLTGDDVGRKPVTAAAAIQEANRWLARAEAILRRRDASPRPVVATPAPRSEPAPPPYQPPPAPPPVEEPHRLHFVATTPPTASAPMPPDEPPPWDETPIPIPLKSRKRLSATDQDDLPF